MPSKTIRIACDIDSSARTIADALTREEIFFHRGNDLVVEGAIFRHGAFETVSGGTVYAEIKASADPAEVALFSGSDTSLGTSTTLPQWKAGTAEHFSIAATKAQTVGLPAGTLWLVIWWSDGGEDVTLYAGRVTVKEDGADNPTEPTWEPDYFVKHSELAEIESFTFKGVWDVDANSPDLSGLTPSAGDTYVVTNAGTSSLTGTSEQWATGDRAIYNGSAWLRSPSSWPGVVRVTDYGALGDNSADDWAAIEAAKAVAVAAGFALEFPNTEQNAYVIAEASASTPDLGGVPLVFAPGVTLSVYNVAHVDYRAWDLRTAVTLEIRSRTASTRLEPNDADRRDIISLAVGDLREMNVPLSVEAIDLTTLEERQYQSIGTTTASVTSATATSSASDAVTWDEDTLNTAYYTGLFTPAEVGMCYEAAIKAAGAGGIIGFIVDCGDQVFRFGVLNNSGAGDPGANVYRRDDDAGTWTKISGDLVVPSRGNGFQTGAIPTLQLRINSRQSFSFYSAGYHIYTATATGANRAIRVGFAVNGNANLDTAVEIRRATKGRMPWGQRNKSLALAINGDSIAFGSMATVGWVDALKQLLLAYGYIDVSIDNSMPYPGDSAAGQYTLAQSFDYSSFDYGIVAVGANDVQSQTDLTSFATSVQGIVDEIEADGCVPILSVPPMFQHSNVTGIGLSYTNYAKGGFYRAAVRHVGASNGLKVAGADYAFGECGADTNGKLVIDNIHPNVRGHVLLAREIARAIIEADRLPAVEHLARDGALLINGQTNEWVDALPDHGYHAAGDKFWLNTPAPQGTRMLLGWAAATTGTSWTEYRDVYPMWADARRSRGGPRPIDFGRLGTGVTGTGAVTATADGYLEVTSGASAGGQARAYQTQPYQGWSSEVNSLDINWDRPVELIAVLQPRTAYTANGVSMLTFGKATSSGFGDLADKGIGVRCDGNALKGVVHDGTTLTVVDLSRTIAANYEPVHLRIYSDGLGNVSWWDDDTLLGTTSAGPTGTGTQNYQILQFEVENNADAAAQTAVLNFCTVEVL